VKLIKKSFLLLLGSLVISPVMASDFDGSKNLICATIEARDCVLGAACYTGHPKKIGAPSFIRVHFDTREMEGEKTTSPIASIQETAEQVLLQGVENGYGWSFALDPASGDFTASLTNTNGSFLLFGSCTPH